MKIQSYQIQTKTVLIILSYVLLLLFSACTNPFMEGILGHGSGSGTRINPWRIGSPDDLLKMGRDDESGWTLDAHYRLTGDITLSEPNWIPIGYEASNIDSFTGTFDGAGYTISNLTINMDASDQGLFARIGSRGTVRNLRLNTVSITTITTGSSNVGSLAGSNNGTVENCYVSGISVVSSGANVGGLIGFNTGRIRNSSSAATVTGITGTNSTGFGGLVGTNGDDGIIENSNVTGNVTSEGHSVGGIAGSNRGLVMNSYTTGNVTGRNEVGGVVGSSINTVINSRSTGNVTGRRNVGGVAGRISIGALIEFCYAEGIITSNGADVTPTSIDFISGVGGIVGFNYGGTVRNCYATGNITIENTQLPVITTYPPPSIGGIAGINTGTILYCYASGIISSLPNNSGAPPHVGGVVGINGWVSPLNSGGTIQSCVALNPTVSADTINQIGRVAGSHELGGTLSNNHARQDMTFSGSVTNDSNDTDGGTRTSWDTAWFRSIGFTNSWWTGRLPSGP